MNFKTLSKVVDLTIISDSSVVTIGELLKNAGVFNSDGSINQSKIMNILNEDVSHFYKSSGRNDILDLKYEDEDGEEHTVGEWLTHAKKIFGGTDTVSTDWPIGVLSHKQVQDLLEEAIFGEERDMRTLYVEFDGDIVSFSEDY